MEKLRVKNIAYMWLSGMQTPDFRTINIFRSKRLAGKFDKIFTQIVLVSSQTPLFGMSTMARVLPRWSRTKVNIFRESSNGMMMPSGRMMLSRLTLPDGVLWKTINRE